MDIRMQVITPAMAKRLIATYPESPGMVTSSEEFSALGWQLVKAHHRKRKSVDPRYQHIIGVTAQGQLFFGLHLLFDIIEKRRAAELYVCTVTDAEETDDLFADMDMEPFPKILGEDAA
jgi:hypothetical protein